MNDHVFTFCGVTLVARADGALHWPEARLLVVSDLHFGKSERIARRAGTLLPPYDSAETLARLSRAVVGCAPETVICLGDSFDDSAAADALGAEVRQGLAGLMAGRRWIWIAGNHDPGPVAMGGTQQATHSEGPLTFRHIANPAAMAEVSGHYHPKARLVQGGAARACFLIDGARVILPAFGAYTGGLATTDPALSGLMGAGALAVLTGQRAIPAPMPRGVAQATGARSSGPPAAKLGAQLGQRDSAAS